MTNTKKESNVGPLWGIFIGTIFSSLGAIKIFTGEPGVHRGMIIPEWAGWVELPFGVYALYLSITALIRNWKISRKKDSE